MIFYGPTDTGKTTLINLFASFIGKKNQSGISLHKIIYDKFAAQKLHGKLLNFCDDLSFKDIKETGGFKIVTGGGYIGAEKKFGELFEFMNYSKLLFATNRFSAIDDTDDMAYYNRWLIVPFDTVFDEKNKKTDKDLNSKLNTKEEMEGLLIWALEGLKRLIENQNFTYTKDTMANRLMMEKNSNSVSAFVQDWLIEEKNNWISKEDLYNIYCKYVQINGGALETKDKFGKVLPKKASFVSDSRSDTKTKKNVRGWRNCGFSSVARTSDPTTSTTLFSILHGEKYNINDNTTKLDSNKDGSAGSKERKQQTELTSIPPQPADIKTTLTGWFNKSEPVEIQQFVGIYPEQYHMVIDQFIKKGITNGEWFECSPGFIKLLE